MLRRRRRPLPLPPPFYNTSSTYIDFGKLWAPEALCWKAQRNQEMRIETAAAAPAAGTLPGAETWDTGLSMKEAVHVCVQDT